MSDMERIVKSCLTTAAPLDWTSGLRNGSRNSWRISNATPCHMRNRENRSSPTTQYVPNSPVADPSNPEAQKPTIADSGLGAFRLRSRMCWCAGATPHTLIERTSSFADLNGRPVGHVPKRCLCGGILFQALDTCGGSSRYSLTVRSRDFLCLQRSLLGQCAHD